MSSKQASGHVAAALAWRLARQGCTNGAGEGAGGGAGPPLVNLNAPSAHISAARRYSTSSGSSMCTRFPVSSASCRQGGLLPVARDALQARALRQPSCRRRRHVDKRRRGMVQQHERVQPHHAMTARRRQRMRTRHGNAVKQLSGCKANRGAHPRRLGTLHAAAGPPALLPA